MFLLYQIGSLLNHLIEFELEKDRKEIARLKESKRRLLENRAINAKRV